MSGPAQPDPSTPRLVVALDGPASSGKSSVGAAVALELGYRFMDTGLLYRALTWLALQRGVGEDDPGALVALLPEVELAADDRGRLAHVTVDSVDVTREVHGPTVDEHVSAISRVPEVRAALLERQRALARPGGIIVAGRDIGTVVLPDADVKLFLRASPEERARRRAEERGVAPDGQEARAILADLRRRDELDSTRAVAPLRPADDAQILVTEGNRFEQTVALVVDAIRAVERRTAREGRAPSRESRGGEDNADAIDGHLTPLIRFVAFGGRVIASGLTRVRIEGDLDAIPRTGPVILAANHASNADPVVIGAWLTPRLGRRIHWLAKKEVLSWPVVGWVAANGGVHPVDRSTADLEAFRLALRILEEGHVLMAFPEGTRSADGTLQRAKDGLAMLALRSGAPIVPIGIVDSDRVWPRGRKLPTPGGRIVIRIGRPFRLVDESRVDGSGARREAKGAATARLMGRIAALLPPRQRGVYAAEADAVGADAAGGGTRSPEVAASRR